MHVAHEGGRTPNGCLFWGSAPGPALLCRAFFSPPYGLRKNHRAELRSIMPDDRRSADGSLQGDAPGVRKFYFLAPTLCAVAECRMPNAECRMPNRERTSCVMGCSLFAVRCKQTAFGQRPTANGQRPTANGQRPTANGQRPTANGQRPTANGQRPTAALAPLRSLRSSV
jgi:hypothetical protein